MSCQKMAGHFFLKIVNENQVPSYKQVLIRFVRIFCYFADAVKLNVHDPVLNSCNYINNNVT